MQRYLNVAFYLKTELPQQHWALGASISLSFMNRSFKKLLELLSFLIASLISTEFGRISSWSSFPNKPKIQIILGNCVTVQLLWNSAFSKVCSTQSDFVPGCVNPFWTTLHPSEGMWDVLFPVIQLNFQSDLFKVLTEISFVQVLPQKLC